MPLNNDFDKPVCLQTAWRRIYLSSYSTEKPKIDGREIITHDVPGSELPGLMDRFMTWCIVSFY